MTLYLRTITLAFCLFATASVGAYPSLQLFADLTPPGTVFRPPPGTYSGPLVINRGITIDGQGEVILDGEGKGSVLTVRADNAVVRGLHITNSGSSHNQVDAGIQLEANNTVIENNIIDNVLFGINIKQANNNIIRGNRISSKDETPSLRGEGIRMWYSRGNLIENNMIDRVRDMFITNSSGNQFIGNTISNSRIGMEFIFSPDNKIEGNTITQSKNGIVVLYSNKLQIRDNLLEKIRDVPGSALAIKESSQVIVVKNRILNCAMGMSANTPTHAENILYIKDNLFAFNSVAMYFYGEKGGHLIHDNRFENNMMHVAVSAASSALGNDWRNNYWDDYEGFDLDNDGVGDSAHSIYLYSDRIWMDRPMTSFFRGSLMLEMVDFVERLAPFSDPDMILSDPSPRVR